jgi:arylsulfatase A-like enzyme
MRKHRRINILQFICHDLGRELNCCDNDSISSPNLDALAARGVLFRHHYAAATPCSPARVCQMTGMYGHSAGLIGLVNHGWDTPAETKTVVDYLNAAGYETYHFGMQHERKDPAANRYMHELGGPGRVHVAGQRLVEFLGSGAAKAGPWYANIGTGEVHLPFDRPEYTPADPGKVKVPPYLPDNDDVRLELARFHGAIKFMDDWIGRIDRALREAGLAEKTLFIFTTDHGAAFPRAKSTLYDPGIGTALIMRFPEEMGLGGQIRDHLVSNIDVTPTLLEMIGRKIPRAVQGKSFWPMLAGGGQPRTEIFSEKNFHDCYDPMRCIRTDRYKYIRSFEPEKVCNMPLPRDIRISIASRRLRPDAKGPRSAEELYDLTKDPNEENNLIGNPACKAVRDDLARRLEEWMRQTRDFLPGPMPTPPPIQPMEPFGVP